MSEMFRRKRLWSILALFCVSATGSAGDTIRLIDRPTDSSNASVERMDLRPDNNADTLTVWHRYRYGGWHGGWYGGFGYRPFGFGFSYFGPRFGVSYFSGPGYFAGYRGTFSHPSYPVFAPPVYAPPVFAPLPHCGPRILAPIAYYPIGGNLGTVGSTVTLRLPADGSPNPLPLIDTDGRMPPPPPRPIAIQPAPRTVTPRDSSYRYDGGPTNPVPLPRPDVKPKEKAQPLERSVSLPASTPKYTYRAYG